MNRSVVRGLLLVIAIFATTFTLSGQADMQLRVRRQTGWDAQAREGRCQIRVWVDNRAEVRLRGEQIFVRTTEGSRGRDEGSECSQPLPFNSVRNFRIRQTAGRSQITLSQEPGRMNNYTALISINDGQGGGDNYAFEASWQADADVQAAPALRRRWGVPGCGLSVRTVSVRTSIPKLASRAVSPIHQPVRNA